VTYSLNQVASLSFTVAQRQVGRKAHGGRCVKLVKANRNAGKCSRLVAMRGGFKQTGRAGANSLGFTGRLRGGKLKPGRYQLVAIPKAGGKTGRAAGASFRIVK
jgi:hypothetical protein